MFVYDWDILLIRVHLSGNFDLQIVATLITGRRFVTG